MIVIDHGSSTSQTEDKDIGITESRTVSEAPSRTLLQDQFKLNLERYLEIESTKIQEPLENWGGVLQKIEKDSWLDEITETIVVNILPSNLQFFATESDYYSVLDIWEQNDEKIEKYISSMEEVVSKRKKEKIKNEITKLLIFGEEEIFEDGMDNRFFRKLDRFVNKFGNNGLVYFFEYFSKSKINLEILSESIKFFGRVESSKTKNVRFCLMVSFLKHNSLMLRDAAGLGLAYLNDKEAVPFIEEAIKKEKCKGLKDDLTQVLLDLKSS